MRVALLFAVLVASAASIQVEILSASHLVAETPFNRMELNENNITIQSKRPGVGTIANKLTFTWVKVSDEFWWTPTSEPTDTGACLYSNVQTVHSNWTVRYENGTNGAVRLTTTATSGFGCQWTMTIFLFTEPTPYKLPPLEFIVKPWEFKLSINISCPWRDQIRNATSWLDPNQEIYLRWRLLNSYVDAIFEFDTPMVGLFDIARSGNRGMSGSDRLMTWCPVNLTEYVVPPRPLNTTFNFSSIAGVKMSSQDSVASVSFLSWGLSDSKNITFVDGDTNEVKKLDDYSFIGRFALQNEFADEFYYDPTLQMLFVGDESNPSVSPSLALENSAVQVVVPSVVTVVVVVAAGGALAVFFVRRSRAKAEARRVKDKIIHSNDKGTKTTVQPYASSPPPPVERKVSVWQPASVPPNF